MNSPKIVFFLSVWLLVGFMQIVYGTFGIPYNYVFLGFAALVALSAGGSLKIDYRCAIFMGMAVLSIIGNDIPYFFKQW